MKKLFALLLCYALVYGPFAPLFASSIIMAGSPVTTTYTASSTLFAGDNQCWMERDGALTGAADGTQCLFSFWYKATGNDDTLQQIFSCNSFRVNLVRNASNYIDLTLQNTSGTTVARVLSDITIKIADGRVNILIACKNTSSGGYLKLYINNVDHTNASTFLANDTSIDFTDTDWGVGDYPGGYHPVYGDLGEFYFNDAASLDLTNAANRQKFVTVGIAPVDLGADGSTPTGGQPIVYLKSAYTSFTTNSGSGGNFVKKGTTAFADGGNF